MPISSFFGGVQRFAGQALNQAQRAYSQADRATGGWLPGGGVASPLSPVRAKMQEKAKETGLNIAGAALNTLPDRVNLFTRYLTGVGNKNLKLDSSTLTDLRRATEKPPSIIQEFRINNQAGTMESQIPGPGFPQSGAVYPYTDLTTPKSVTNTLGRFTANLNPAEHTIQIKDTYDMSNRSEDPDLVSGKIQPQKAWNELESVWNPAATTRNTPHKITFPFPQEEYNIENVKTGLTTTGKSSTYSPATRFARALMYLTPIKPEPYDINVTMPLTGEIK